MLLSMTLANYKSVKNPQTISFVALGDKRLDLTKTVQGTDKFNVLKTSAIIGPNGAGKSSFVRALEAVKGIVFASKYSKLAGLLDRRLFSRVVINGRKDERGTFIVNDATPYIKPIKNNKEEMAG